MLLVTGTKRSGTSLWMQILEAAGVPVIGERFPLDWEDKIAEANPQGFWESRLAGGIFFATNPNPHTGEFLFPDQVRVHAVKVFVPGLLRTDYAFIDHVIATVRPWREFCQSLTKLERLVSRHSHLSEDPRFHSSELHPALHWWEENFALIRDLTTRRYPAHVQSFGELLRDPERVIAECFEWLGLDAPVPGDAVDQELYRNRASSLEPASHEGHDLEQRTIDIFDELYDAIDRRTPMSDAFVEELNETQRRLAPRFLQHRLQQSEQLAQTLRESTRTDLARV